MKFKRWFKDSLVVLSLASFSLFPYAGSLSRWRALLLEYYPNLLVLSAVFLILCEAQEGFTSNSPSFLLEREFSALSRMGKLSLSLIGAYLAESFLFFSHNLGRLTYASFFLLSLLYSLTRKTPKIPRVLWKAETPLEEIKKKYPLLLKPAREIPHSDLVVVNGSLDKETLSKLLAREGVLVLSLEEFVENLGKLVPLELKPEKRVAEEVLAVEKNSYEGIKRLLEVPAALIALLLLFPPALLLALIHQIESPGPIFYLQERLGKDGRPFRLIKFRTMVPNAEPEGKPVFAKKDDPRITRIGKIIRKLHLDEVPQLLNVIKGDMSLVGPRPERPEISRVLERKLPLYPLRTRVRPGVTGWAQIHFGYAGDDFQQHLRKLEYDLYYIKHRNFYMDLHILYRTFLLFLRPALD